MAEDAPVTRPEFESLHDDVKELQRQQEAYAAQITQMNVKISEMHVENRVRAEHAERVSTEGIQKLAAKIDNLHSVRGWIGWAVVTAASASVATTLAHFGTHLP